jgi:hypothetical protein
MPPRLLYVVVLFVFSLEEPEIQQKIALSPLVLKTPREKGQFDFR